MEKLTPQQLNIEAFKCELRVMPFSEVADYRPLLTNIEDLDAHLKNQVALALYRDKAVDKQERVNKAMSIWNKVGDAEATFLLSTAYFQHDKKERGVATLRRAINLGSVPAQLRAGYCTLMGIGVTPDLEKASNIFKRLAKQKVPEAVYFTGALFMMGSESTPKDPEKARKMLMWSVENGCKFAEFEHGVTLLQKPETKKEGIDYIMRAAEKQEVRAMMWLAIELARGTTLAPDIKLSQKYMEQCYNLKFQPAVDAISEAIANTKANKNTSSTGKADNA